MKLNELQIIRTKPALAAMLVAVGLASSTLGMQPVGGAMASTTEVAEDWSCPERVACLWKHLQKNGNSAERVLITPDPRGPDMILPTREGVGRVHSTAPLHDSISKVHNGTSYGLCMIDTQFLGSGQYQNWGSILVISAHGGEVAMRRGDPFNDKIDTYTLAAPGACPVFIRFNGTTSNVLESH